MFARLQKNVDLRLLVVASDFTNKCNTNQIKMILKAIVAFHRWGCARPAGDWRSFSSIAVRSRCVQPPQQKLAADASRVGTLNTNQFGHTMVCVNTRSREGSLLTIY